MSTRVKGDERRREIRPYSLAAGEIDMDPTGAGMEMEMAWRKLSWMSEVEVLRREFGGGVCEGDGEGGAERGETGGGPGGWKAEGGRGFEDSEC